MSNQELESIELDYAEIKSILDSHASRESTKRLLQNELSRLENVKKSLANRSTKTLPAAAELIPLSNYAWDQTDKFVKIYLYLDGVKEPFEDDSIKLTFPDESSLRIVLGRYKFTLTKLHEKINTQESYFKRTSSKIIIYLVKKREAKWSNLQYSKPTTVYDEKDKEDPDADPSNALMSLMKKMYQEGDDEMKRTIAKSWYEAQNKKEPEIDLP